MAIWKPDNTTAAGIRAELQDSIEAVPDLWSPHCQRIDLNTQTETFPWLGDLPSPRVMTDGRLFQGIAQYTYDVSAEEHELSFIIDRKMFEDQQHGMISQRIREVGEAWPTYKNSLFTTMLTNGATGTAWDGNTFFDDTRTVGSSGTIDNALTSAAATGTIPTSAEFLTGINSSKTSLHRFLSDTGKPTPNLTAMSELRVIVPPSYERAAVEAVNSTMVSSSDNVWGKGIAIVDVNPFLTADTIMYVHATGSVKKGIIYAERTALEIDIRTDPESMNDFNGVAVFLRQRFNFKYGDFYKMIQYTYS